jgi:hypothetical protein
MYMTEQFAMNVVPITPEADEFERRWANWVRWCNSKGFYQGRTGSLEGAYRSPQCWNEELPKPPPIDLLDAVVMNRAYVRLWTSSEKAAKTIQYLVFRHPNMRPTGQAQLLGVHYMRLEQELQKAKRMMRNLLRG